MLHPVEKFKVKQAKLVTGDSCTEWVSNPMKMVNYYSCQDVHGEWCLYLVMPKPEDGKVDAAGYSNPNSIRRVRAGCGQ